MGKIGDWIHYSGYAYDQYGTTKNDDFDEITNIYAIQKTEMNKHHFTNKSLLSKKKKEQLEKTIGTFMVNPDNDEKIASLQNQAKEKIAEYMIGELAKGNFNFSTGKIEGISTEGKIGKVHSHYILDNNSKGLYINLASITKKINKLEDLYLKEISKKQVDLEKLQQVEEQYKKLVGHSAKELQNYNFKKNPNNLSFEGSFKDIREFRNNINELIQTYAAYPDLPRAEGLSFEVILAAIEPLLNNSLEDIVDDDVIPMIEKNLKGDVSKSHQQQYNKENFATTKLQLGQNTFLEGEYNQRAKVDVHLKWQGINLKISAKNVSLQNGYTWVTVVKDTPLMYLLQDVNSRLVNHFINMHAVVGASQKKDLYKETVDSVIKNILLYKGMTGDTYGRQINDVANLIIINDKNSQYGVRVFNIEDILKPLLKDSSGIKTQVEGKNIRDLKLPNYKDPQNRAALILNRMHMLKVIAGFNLISVLNKE